MLNIFASKDNCFLLSSPFSAYSLYTAESCHLHNTNCLQNTFFVGRRQGPSDPRTALLDFLLIFFYWIPIDNFNHILVKYFLVVVGGGAFWAMSRPSMLQSRKKIFLQTRVICKNCASNPDYGRRRINHSIYISPTHHVNF